MPLPADHDVVSAARSLAPLVAELAEEIETTGRLPVALVDRLTETGLYHLYLPANMGGPEVAPVAALLAIEALARADGSVAWCAHVSSANAWQLATLAPPAVAVMAAITAETAAGAGPGHARPGWRLSGSARPLGRLRRVEGGYVVNGTWDFASNCLHATWYCGACISEEGGRRRTRAVFIPINDGEVLDTWHVAGLRGTGSHDFAVREVFVPEARVAAGRHLAAQPSPLYRQRLTMVANWALTAGVGLGIARGALDAFGGLSGQGTANETEVALRDRAEVQSAVGRCEALLGAARAYCLDAIGRAWELAGEVEPGERTAADSPTDTPGGSRTDARAAAGPDGGPLGSAVFDARLAITHALHTAVDIVDRLFTAGGTRSIFQRSQLERRFRDAHVAAQHGAGAPAHFQTGGRLALGLPAKAPFW